jgi:hypothetical protein
VIRWVGRIGGAVIAMAVLGVLLFATARFLKNDAGHKHMAGALTATNQLRSQLRRDAHVKMRVLPDDGTDDDLELTVVYPAATPQPERKDIYASTNIIVRRHVPNVRDVKVIFGDDTLEDLTPALIDAGELPPSAAATPVALPPNAIVSPPTPARAAAPTPAPAAAAAPAPAAAAKKPAHKGPTGSVTLVTFPNAKVLLGKETLGNTPLFNYELPVGTHLVTLVGEDGTRHRLSLPVKAGKNPALKVNLSDLPSR